MTPTQRAALQSRAEARLRRHQSGEVPLAGIAQAEAADILALLAALEGAEDQTDTWRTACREAQAAAEKARQERNRLDLEARRAKAVATAARAWLAAQRDLERCKQAEEWEAVAVALAHVGASFEVLREAVGRWEGAPTP